jgi:hypothetical protein
MSNGGQKGGQNGGQDEYYLPYDNTMNEKINTWSLSKFEHSYVFKRTLKSNQII